jgi:pimeloyl-ACP methyl ester carboxylesterase
MPASTPSPPPLTPAHLHDDQVIALLRSGLHSHLLSAFFGEAEYQELTQLAKLAATRSDPRGAPVLILPGIMGSRLAMKRGRTLDLYWLHPAAIAQGHLAKLALPGTRGLRPIGVMLPGYLKMKLMLEIGGFRPVLHAFDWRMDIESNARALIRVLESTGVARTHVIAHSMGGLIARAALRHDKRRLIGTLIQVGAPNEGSYAPVLALRAVYPTVRKIAALDRMHTAEDLARKVFLTLPGLYQLLPTPQPNELDLFDAANWPSDLAPDARLLEAARKARGRLPDPDARCFVVAGTQQDTITAIRRTGDEFAYGISSGGDGTVPLARALWPGARTWYSATNHGALSTDTEVLSALIELLQTGDTARLSTSAPPPAAQSRTVSDSDLRRHAQTKLEWDALSLESRRRILEPIFTAEFAARTDD